MGHEGRSGNGVSFDANFQVDGNGENNPHDVFLFSSNPG